MVACSGGVSLANRVAKLHDLFVHGLLTEEEFAAARTRVLKEGVVEERKIRFAIKARDWLASTTA